MPSPAARLASYSSSAYSSRCLRSLASASKAYPHAIKLILRLLIG
jgi:hypothetical protein